MQTESARASLAQLQSVFDLAPIGITNVGPDGRFLRTNAAFQRLLGYTPGELQDLTLSGITHPDDREESDALVRDLVIGRRENFATEKRYRRKDGSYIWGRVTVAAVRNDTGQLLYALAMTEDISERKATEAALHARLAFEDLITGISTTFINLPPEAVDDGINAALARIGRFAGVDRTYVFLLRDSAGAPPPGDQARMDNTHEWCAEGIAPEIDHLQDLPTMSFPWCNVRLLKGQLIHVPRVADMPPEAAFDQALLAAQDIRSVLLVPMMDRGVLIGFLGFDAVREEKTWTEESITLLTIVGEVFVNAVVRSRAEQALRASEDRFRTLFEQSPNGIALYNPQGWLTRGNAAFYALFGLPRDRPIRHYLPSDPRLEAAGVLPLIQRAFAGEPVIVPPLRYDTSADPTVPAVRVRHVGASIYPLRDEVGQMREVAVVFSDATERVEAYESLEARVAERTRQLTALLDISREVASTLELDPLLGLILDRLGSLIDATALAVTVLDGDDLVQVEYRGPLSREAAIGRRFAIDRRSTIWRSFRENRPIVIDDLLADTVVVKELRQAFQQARPRVAVTGRSWLGVPLVRKGEPVGMLALAHNDPGHFAESDARLIAAFAAQAAVGIENANLYRDVQHRLAQVEALSAVGAALVEERNLGRVLRTVGERVIALLNADGCAVALLDPDEAARQPGHELELAVVIGERETDLQGMRIPLDGSFLGEAILTGGPVISGDTATGPRGYPPAIRRPHSTMLALPLRTSERVVGALNVFGRDARPFDERDVALMTLFAQQAAVAIENARLYEQAQSLAVLEERQRLARELHDSVSQALYGIALGARTARTLLDRDPARMAGPLDYVLNLAEAGLTEMRALIFELRPESLATEGLGAALSKMADAIRVRHHLGVDLDLCDELDAPLPVKEALYRIAQEATNNAIKHARARRLALRLADEDGTCLLEVRDDGSGFDPGGDFSGHFGLTSMQERAGRLGGTLTVASAPGQGTTVRVRLPLAAP